MRGNHFQNRRSLFAEFDLFRFTVAHRPSFESDFYSTATLMTRLSIILTTFIALPHLTNASLHC